MASCYTSVGLLSAKRKQQAKFTSLFITGAYLILRYYFYQSICESYTPRPHVHKTRTLQHKSQRAWIFRRNSNLEGLTSDLLSKVAPDIYNTITLLPKLSDNGEYKLCLILEYKGRFPTKLCCCVGGKYNKVIWFYQLG